ncbi:hypothetical protein AXK11_03220 [Cephaloticoccus primus]|uniref:DUF218 domain-containing protein n=1 Tax=Cephaloticoccus primus TaxID=1548207 RepID=A0A139SQS1_9BACT|nr:ElyC/SanA/YdcF family protein [Cephaloticoccus primus]KXU36820.1 hypothetical protein AXK11_03220 [Cephaloticoccus primus]
MQFLFLLKKVVTYFLLPLQLSLLLMLLGGALCSLTRRKGFGTLGKISLSAGILLLLVLSHKQVGIALLQPLETRYAAIPELAPGEPLPAALAECRAIVVFAGGVSNTPWLPATSRLSEVGLARLVEGVRLARLLPDALLILTGPAYEQDAPESETAAAALARAAESLGIAPERMRLITAARDTEGEVAALHALYGDMPLALVSSASHMPRIMGYAQKAGLHALACPAGYKIRPNAKFRWHEWTADISGLGNSTGGIYERLGTLWARLRGRTD